MVHATLSKVVFIQHVAKFASSSPKKVIKLSYVDNDWRHAILDYSFDLLLVPLLSSTSKFHQEQQQTGNDNNSSNNNKKLARYWSKFRRLFIRLLAVCSPCNFEIVERFAQFVFKELPSNKINHDHNDDHSSFGTDDHQPQRRVLDFINESPINRANVSDPLSYWQMFLGAIRNTKASAQAYALFEDKMKVILHRIRTPIMAPYTKANFVNKYQLEFEATKTREAIQAAATAGNLFAFNKILNEDPNFFREVLRLIAEIRNSGVYGSQNLGPEQIKRILYYATVGAGESGSVEMLKLIRQKEAWIWKAQQEYHAENESNNNNKKNQKDEDNFGKVFYYDPTKYSGNMKGYFVRALKKNHVDMVKYLVETHQMRPSDTVQCSYVTAFSLALEYGSVDVIKYFLDFFYEYFTSKYGTEEATKIKDFYTNFRPFYTNITSLQLAALPDKPKIFSNKRNSSFDSPLHILAKMKEVSLSKSPNRLIIPSYRGDADDGSNKKKSDGKNVDDDDIVHSVSVMILKMIVEFIVKEENVGSKDDPSNKPQLAVNYFAFHGNLKTVLNRYNRAGETPIVAAAKNNNKEFVQFLLKNNEHTSKALQLHLVDKTNKTVKEHLAEKYGKELFDE